MGRRSPVGFSPGSTICTVRSVESLAARAGRDRLPWSRIGVVARLTHLLDAGIVGDEQRLRTGDRGRLQERERGRIEHRVENGRQTPFAERSADVGE